MAARMKQAADGSAVRRSLLEMLGAAILRRYRTRSHTENTHIERVDQVSASNCDRESKRPNEGCNESSLV